MFVVRVNRSTTCMNQFLSLIIRPRLWDLDCINFYPWSQLLLGELLPYQTSLTNIAIIHCPMFISACPRGGAVCTYAQHVQTEMEIILC